MIVSRFFYVPISSRMTTTECFALFFLPMTTVKKFVSAVVVVVFILFPFMIIAERTIIMKPEATTKCCLRNIYTYNSYHHVEHCVIRQQRQPFFGTKRKLSFIPNAYSLYQQRSCPIRSNEKLYIQTRVGSSKKCSRSAKVRQRQSLLQKCNLLHESNNDDSNNIVRDSTNATCSIVIEDSSPQHQQQQQDTIEINKQPKNSLSKTITIVQQSSHALPSSSTSSKSLLLEMNSNNNNNNQRNGTVSLNHHTTRRKLLFDTCLIYPSYLWTGSLLLQTIGTPAMATGTNDNGSTTTNSNSNNYEYSKNDGSSSTIVPYSSIRKYKSITLGENNLRVLLVCDKTSMQSSCAMTIHGAGQYSDPMDLPGLAHLLEHIVLSYVFSSSSSSSSTTTTTPTSPSTTAAGIPDGSMVDDSTNNPTRTNNNNPVSSFFTKQQQRTKKTIDWDFEDWIAERCDGASNGYTAYDHVCYHFSFLNTNNNNKDINNLASSSSSSLLLQEALIRFATLFQYENVVRTCWTEPIVSREIGRVDSELDYTTNPQRQIEYLTKAFVNSEHPYSRFSAGSYKTLDPTTNKKNMGQRLIDFFRTRYLASQAVLVVISNKDLSTMERWISPFRTAFMYGPPQNSNNNNLDDFDDEDDDDDVVVSFRRSKTNQIPEKNVKSHFLPCHYPGRFLYGNRYKHLLLYVNERQSENDRMTTTQTDDNSVATSNKRKTPPPASTINTERICIQWVLNMNYQEMMKTGKPCITATHIGFVLTQIFGRKGPGSLYSFLFRRGWVPPPSTSSTTTIPLGIPRISIPIDTSGFQIIKLELFVTMDGFRNRSRVVTAIYDAMEVLQTSPNSYLLPRALLTQYASMATLFGYLLSPRPPDAIELATDIQLHSMESVVATYNEGKKWYRFPQPDDIRSMMSLQSAISKTILKLIDPDSAVIIVTASKRTILSDLSSSLSIPIPKKDENAIATRTTGSNPFPSLSSSSTTTTTTTTTATTAWFTEPISGARFLYDNNLIQKDFTVQKIEQFIVSKIIDRTEIISPPINPLIPTILRPSRPIRQQQHYPLRSDNNNSNNNEPLAMVHDEAVAKVKASVDRNEATPIPWKLVSVPNMLQQHPFFTTTTIKRPPEPTCHCMFVIELLSSRPARANVRQAARAELWKLYLDEIYLVDVAELGAPGSLSYEMSYNKFGIRLAFHGPSPTLSSYVRRIWRRILESPFLLQNGPILLPQSIPTKAIAAAKRFSSLDEDGLVLGGRRQRIISNLKSSTAHVVSEEALLLLQSCTGAVAFAHGDLVRSEANQLVSELYQLFQSIVLLSSSTTKNDEPTVRTVTSSSRRTAAAATPEIMDLLYKPIWKPRNGSPCAVPGVNLISDACGRVPR